MIVPGRLAKPPTHNIGMISPIHRADKKAPHQSLNCHVANAVVRPDGHSVPIRILNVLDKPTGYVKAEKSLNLHHLSNHLVNNRVHVVA